MILLRAALGLLAIFFSYCLGRSVAALHQRRETRTRTITWVLRATVCLMAVFWGQGLDALSAAVTVLAVAALATGLWVQSRPPKDERLVEKMFPKE